MMVVVALFCGWCLIITAFFALTPQNYVIVSYLVPVVVPMYLSIGSFFTLGNRRGKLHVSDGQVPASS
jgi:hypothetical protein